MNRLIVLILLVGSIGLAFGGQRQEVHSGQPKPVSSSGLTPVTAPGSTSQSPETELSELGLPSLRVFSDKDGLPQNSILSMALDHRGYLWVGTRDGAARYNGRMWTAVNMPNRTRSNMIWSILTTTDGSLWFGTNGGGLVRLKDETWTIFDTQTGLPHNNVFCLTQAKTGNQEIVLWVGTEAGLGRLQLPLTATDLNPPGTWTTFTTAAGLPNNRVNCLLETAQGTLWAGTASGLARLNENVWTQTGLPPTLTGSTIRSLLETRDNGKANAIWVGTEGNGITRLSFAGAANISSGPFQVNVFGTDAGLPNATVYSLMETQRVDGTSVLWAGTYGGGLARFQNGKWKAFDTKAGLPSNVVKSMIEVPQVPGRSTLWIGTESGGLVRVDRYSWLHFDTTTGLPSDEVNGLLETVAPDGTSAYWFATYYGGVARFEKGVWTTFNTNSGLPSNLAFCLLETRAADGGSVIWVGTFGGGLARYEKGRWSTIDTNSGLPHNRVTRLLRTPLPDGSETIWVGTYGGGVGRYEHGRWTVLDTSSGLPNNRIQSLAATPLPNGGFTIWIGTDGGLSRFEEGKFQTLDTTSGLPNNQVISLLETIDPDNTHFLWVGTLGGGAVRIPLGSAGGPWQTFSDVGNPPLANNSIYQIREDAQKRVYFFTGKGVCRLTPRLNGPGQPATFQIQTFTTEDGLPSNECNFNASLVDRQGRIWVGTHNGAALLDPAGEIVDRGGKPLFIENSWSHSRNQPLRANEALRYNENHLLFEFALLNFLRESKTRYQTQLVGLEDKPSGWTTENKREFTSLPPGKYVFQVWGKDSSENITGPVTFAFRIYPAPWQTWWAYTFYGLALLGVGWGSYEWRLRTLHRRQQERIAYLRQLLESTWVINSQLDLNTVLQRIASEGARLVGGEPGGIGLVQGQTVVFQRLWKMGNWEESNLVFQLGEGVAGMVAATGQPRIVNDPAACPEIVFPENLEEFAIKGWLDIPIVSRTGQVVGVLDIRRPEGRAPFTEADQGLLESLAHQAAVAIENAELYGEVEARKTQLEEKNFELEEKNMLIGEAMRELEKLYQNERQVTQTLQELNQMKTNFMVVTSHEMRTPLTVLKGYTETLLDGLFGPLTDMQRASVSACHTMVERMVLNFEGFLEMLKISENGPVLNHSRFEVAQVMHQLAAEFAPFCEQRNQTLKVMVAPELFLCADRKKFHLVLQHLIQNAIKFTYDGGEIRLSAKTDGELIHVLVEDSGIGIDSNEATKIFEQFYTSADSSKHTSGRFKFLGRGAGLGLAICKSYVEAHGGLIWVESAGSAQGSRFQFTLPLNGPLADQDHPSKNRPANSVLP
ncbi:MAG: GAF domain-containing protein [Blastocatellia bacterium]|nr:GAF domain-containing protein [Blastocatellia bacterium]